MDARKAFMLAVAPGAEVDTSSPTREARVSLTHAVGHILLLDETGGDRCHYIPNNRKATRWQVPPHPEHSSTTHAPLSMKRAEHRRCPLTRRIAYV